MASYTDDDDDMEATCNQMQLITRWSHTDVQNDFLNASVLERSDPDSCSSSSSVVNRRPAADCPNNANRVQSAAIFGRGSAHLVTLRRARLVLGWWPYRNSTPGERNLSQPNQPPRQLSLAIPLLVGANALRLGVKADMVLFAGNTVWPVSERIRGVCA